MKRVVTYSKNVFIPVTEVCRNRCGYCSFRKDLAMAKTIGRDEAASIIEAGHDAGCKEALFTMGDRPWEVAGMREHLQGSGIGDLIDYIIELCELAIEGGLLPHTNAGILGDDELERIAPYNASMGLMLETTRDVRAHIGSSGKRPDLRVSFIESAGRQKIPFTTGILVGIGEDRSDRIQSLRRIAELHKAYGHLQEVIIQPFDPKPGTLMAGATPPGIEVIVDAVRLARRILPADVAVQVPPNLVDPKPLVDSGASDLGGLSPVTLDWINPDRTWPSIEKLRKKLCCYELLERLPVYPKYIHAGWHGRHTRKLVNELANVDGLLR